jgi:hypothetical protein
MIFCLSEVSSKVQLAGRNDLFGVAAGVFLQVH